MKRRAAAAAATLALVPAGTAQAAFRFPQKNVSNTTGRQAETAIAADPTNPQVLLAASNSGIVRGSNFRVSALAYGSTDGGATWTRSEPVPPSGGDCDYGDPAPGIGPDGAQHLATLVAPCDLSGAREDETVALVVSSRAGPTAPWTTTLVSKPDSLFNDKPALTVDTGAASVHRGRIYVAWSLSGPDARAFSVVVARSDDGGATWSAPVRVSRAGLRHSPEQFVSLGVDAAGTLFVAWATGIRDVFIARSTDGGDTFGLAVLVASPAGISGLGCAGLGIQIAAQPERCVTPAPLVTVAVDRVVVTYGGGLRQQDVFADSLDLALARRLSHARVNRPDGTRRADQFLPTASYDPSTGKLWACFYDTRADRRRVRARYSCASSADRGATWAPSFPVASVGSDETRRPADSGFGFGDYEGVVAAGGIVHPIWTDGRLVRTRGEEIFTTAFAG